MGVVKYLLGLVFITIFSAISLTACLLRINPYQASWGEMAIFYLSLFLSLAGFFSLFGVFLRKARSRFYLRIKMIIPAFRQGIILAGLIVILLFLQGERALNWTGVLSLIIVSLLLEIFFIRRTKKE